MARRRTRLRVLLLMGPLALLVATLRLAAYSILRVPGTPPVADVMWHNAPLPFLIVLIGGAFFAWTQTAWPKLHPAGRTAAALALTAALLGAAAFAAPWWMTAWLTWEAFEFVRWDLLLLAAVTLTSVMLIDGLRGAWRRIALAGLHGLALALALLLTIEFGYFVAVGSPGGWPVLRYFAVHLRDVLPVLASELHGGRWALLLLPLALVLAPTGIEKIASVRRWLAAAPPDTPRLQPLWAALPLLLVLALTPRAALDFAQPGSFYVEVMREALFDPAMEAEALGRLAHPAEPIFDAYDLRLGATDSTRLLNVVIVVLESVRRRSTTPYEPTLDTTPFLDSLARRALLVEEMTTVVPHTNKSLVALIAGIYPMLSRNVAESAPGGVPGRGLPDLLRPFGYRSAFFTPATLAYEEKEQLLANLGFDLARGDGDHPTEGFSKKIYFGYEDRIALEPSLAWVDAAQSDGHPFFLTYLTLSSHHPYDTPPAFGKREGEATPPALDDYYDALRYTDAFLRDLFDAFAARGLLNETLFIVLGDHGEAFGEHGQQTHGDVIWDEALSVPALLFNPVLFPDGGHITGPRQHVDVLPTLADALGLRLEGGRLPGRSLLQPAPEGRSVFHSAWNGKLALALRRDSLKFVYHYRRRPTQVFDLHSDPLEQHDLAPHLPAELIRAAELDLLLWNREVARVYAGHRPHSITPVAHSAK